MLTAALLPAFRRAAQRHCLGGAGPRVHEGGRRSPGHPERRGPVPSAGDGPRCGPRASRRPGQPITTGPARLRLAWAGPGPWCGRPFDGCWLREPSDGPWGYRLYARTWRACALRLPRLRPQLQPQLDAVEPPALRVRQGAPVPVSVLPAPL